MNDDLCRKDLRRRKAKHLFTVADNCMYDHDIMRDMSNINKKDKRDFN